MVNIFSFPLSVCNKARNKKQKKSLEKEQHVTCFSFSAGLTIKIVARLGWSWAGRTTVTQE